MPKQDSHIDRVFRRVLGNTGWLFGANLANLALSLAQGIVIARLLGVAQFGVFSLITTFAYFVNQFFDSRSWETVIKYYAQYQQAGDSKRATAIVKLCYLIDTATGGLAFLFVFLCADVGARVFVKDPSTSRLISLYALTLLLGIPMSTSSALLRVGNRFGWLAAHQTGVAVLRLALTTAALLLGFGIAGAVFAYLLSSAVASLVILLLSWVLWSELQLVSFRQAPLRLLRGTLRQLAHFLVTTNLHALVKLFQTSADVLLIGAWLNPTAVGYYQIGRKIAGLLSLPVGPLSQAIYPEFARLAQSGQRELLRRLLLRNIALAGSFSLAFVFSVVPLAGWLIWLVFGAEYVPATSVTRCLILAAAVGVSFGCFRPFLIALGRPGSALLAVSVGVAVQLALLAVLLPSLGVLAGGISQICFILVWLLGMLLALRLRPGATESYGGLPRLVG